jgi:hypothetical protein
VLAAGNPCRVIRGLQSEQELPVSGPSIDQAKIALGHGEELLDTALQELATD